MTTHPKIWLPNAAKDLIDRTAIHQRHPGLQLDKLSLAEEQKDQSPAIDAVTECIGDIALLEELLQRRNEVLDRLGSARFEGRTLGPMTLHLSRAGGLENAGLALHPVYGFAWLPGTGLKGMTRAWAETVWKQGNADIETARTKNCRRLSETANSQAVSCSMMPGPPVGRSWNATSSMSTINNTMRARERRRTGKTRCRHISS